MVIKKKYLEDAESFVKEQVDTFPEEYSKGCISSFSIQQETDMISNLAKLAFVGKNYYK